MAKFREMTVEAWNLAIEDGLDYRRRYGRESEWAKNESIWAQAHETQDKNVGPNILYSTGDALLSTLLTPNPFYLVKAMKQDVVQAAPVLETQLNNFIHALKIKDKIQMLGLHTFLYSHGIMKVGYDSEFGYCPEYDLGVKSGQIFGMTLNQFDKKGQRIEYDQSVQPGMPWCEPVLPHNFVVPTGVVTLERSPWCAERMIRHIDDIKADPRYSNKRNLQPTMSMADWVKSYMTVMKPYRAGKAQYSSMKDMSSKAEYVELWEIHDARTGRLMVIASGHDEFLRDEVDYLQLSGLPYVDLTFNPRARTFWTTPDTVYLQNFQAEAIDIAHMTRKQRRISLLRFLYAKGSVTPENLVKFFSGEVGVGLEVEGDIDKTFKDMTPFNNNNQLTNEANAIREDARETCGFGRNQVGQMTSGRHSATEANIVAQKSEIRLDRRMDAVAGLYSELGKKLSQIIFTFWKTPRLVEIIGQFGASQWTSFTGDVLQGDYLYQVGFSDEPIETKTSRQNRALQMYQFFAQDPTIDPIALRQYLARAFNDPEFNGLFKQGVLQNAPLPVQMPQGQLPQPVGGSESNVPQRSGQDQVPQVPELVGQGTQ